MRADPAQAPDPVPAYGEQRHGQPGFSIHSVAWGARTASGEGSGGWPARRPTATAYGPQMRIIPHREEPPGPPGERHDGRPTLSGASAFARRDLDRLIALGRQRGELTPADLQAALPIQSMSAEAIAQVVLDLDAAGIAVELEDLVPGLAHPGGIAPVPLAPALGPASPAVPASSPRVSGAKPRQEAPSASSEGQAEADPPAREGRVGRAVLVAGLIVLALLIAVLMLLGR